MREQERDTAAWVTIHKLTCTLSGANPSTLGWKRAWIASALPPPSSHLTRGLGTPTFQLRLSNSDHSYVDIRRVRAGEREREREGEGGRGREGGGERERGEKRETVSQNALQKI